MSKSKSPQFRANRFVPHHFKSEIKLTSQTPLVLVSPQAYEDMHYLVGLSKDEIGWLGSVKRVGAHYMIEEIFLIEQQVNATNCEITPDGLAAWMQDIMVTRKDGLQVANSIRFWGHSHVNMRTSPSGQDDRQMDVLAANCDDYFIRGILNKAGRMEFTLYLYEIGIEIHDATWLLYEPQSQARLEQWQQQIDSKVKPKVYALHKKAVVKHQESQMILQSWNPDEKPQEPDEKEEYLG